MKTKILIPKKITFKIFSYETYKLHSIVDFTGGVVATVISIVVCFAIIGGLIYYIKRSKKRKNMVHNKKKKNDSVN